VEAVRRRTCDHGAMSSPALEALEAFALGLPGAFPDMPWEGDVVAKVGKKIFVFLGEGDPPAISVKLPESAAHALSVPGASPTSYGLGRHGWVTVPIGDTPLDLLQDWIEESYRTIATKRYVAELDARSAG
jgi:predicted DNA-binding protein (MmcQ/YjbR family)